MKNKIAQFLIFCILFTVVIPLNVWAADNMKFTMDENYVNGNIYSTVSGVMADQGSYIAWNKYGLVKTSSDGLNWTSGSSTWTNSKMAGNLSKVVYNDKEKKYVGIGENCYASSSDGKKWELETSSQNQDINDLLYANGKYYAVNSGLGGNIQQSADGKSWETLTPGLPNTGNNYYSLNAITYGNDKYIVVGSAGKVLSSTDGENWNNQTLELEFSYIYLKDVIYAGGQYVIVGSSGAIYTSDNGNSWIKRDSGLTDYDNDLQSISYGNGKYVVVGASKVISSTDGINWSEQSGTSRYDSVCFGSAGFVATEGMSAAHSKNGTSWTEKDLRSTQTISYIADLQFLNGQYVAVGKGFMSSVDGATWTRKNDSEDLLKISYGNGKYVGIGSGRNSTIVKTSINGVTWQPQIVNVTGYFSPSDLSYGNGKFVMVGYHGMILYSADGVNWTEAASGVTSFLLSVVYANGRFIATGNNGTILSSNDGIDWSTANSGLSSTDYNNWLTDLAVGNEQIIGVGGSGVIVSSSDGITWTKRQSGTTCSLEGVSYGNGRFVAIGEEGTVLSSTDGETWTDESPLTTGSLGIIASNGSGFLISMSRPNDALFRSTSSSAASVTGVSLNKTLVSIVGQTDLLVATIKPANAANKAVTWKSSNPSVATVDQNGNVTGVTVGSAVITVTTVDGSKQATCKITVQDKASSVKDITSFKVSGQVGSSTIDLMSRTITFHMASGSNIKKLAPTIVVSAGTTIAPKSKAAKDFTNPVVYTVTAKDKTSEAWTVTCVVDPKSSANDITSFKVSRQVGNSTIDLVNHTISFHMKNGSSIKRLKPSIIVSAGAIISPKSKAAKDFASPVSYTVTAQDGTIQIWTVTCE